MRPFLTAQLIALLFAPLAAIHAAAAPQASKPNIVYVLCDDLGYGDVHCLNAQRGKIATPHIDRLVGQGISFTDAHSSSAVCTPSRYGILTGRYNWRSQLQAGVLGGFSSPLIAASRLTVPALLKQHGYATACIGKWHLGMKISEKRLDAPIGDGPTTRGFDYYFGISASLDMPPFAFIENNRFTEMPTVQKTFVRAGIAAPSFEPVDVLPTLTRKAVVYVGEHAKAGAPVLSVPAVERAARPDRSDERMAGKERTREVRRLRHGNRLGGRRSARRARQRRHCRQHARHFHQ